MNEIQTTANQEIKDTPEIEPTGDLHTDGGQLSYRQLIWRRFRKNRMGIIAGVILIVFYLLAIGADFFAPYHYSEINMRLRHVPPQRLHFSFQDGFYVHALKSVRNPESLELEFTVDTTQRQPVQFFFKDAEGRRHLFSSAGPMFLLGTDRMGTRPAFANHVRGACLNDTRFSRCLFEHHSRFYSRHYLRLLRRLDRQSDPTDYRNPFSIPGHPAMDGTRCRTTPRLVEHPNLFRDYDYPINYPMGRIGTTGAGKGLGISGKRFRDGGACCWRRTMAHYHETPAAWLLQSYHRHRHTRYSGHDFGGNRA